MFKKKEFGWRSKKVPNSWYAISCVNILLLLALLIVFVTPVSAITGTGGTISLNSEIGSISYNGINSQLNAYGGSSMIYGIVNATGFDGRLGLLGQLENVNTNFSIISPANGIIILGTSATFNYLPVGEITNCLLYVDNNLQGSNANPVMNTINSFSVNNLAVGKHTWDINCTFNQYILKKSGEFSIIISSIFNSSSTNLNGINASSIPNLTLSRSAGTIVFDGNTDLSSGVNLNTNVVISPRSIYINSANAPMLNKSATLTLNDILFSNVIIWRDGAVCTDCSVISLSNNKLVFSVTQFSNYTITSSSKLEIFDDSDFAKILPNQTMMFSANYTNITSGAPITGSCDITIPNSGTYAMTYNAISKTYQYTSSFVNTGIKSYIIQCTPSQLGFDILDLTSNFVITGMAPPTFADINVTTGLTSSMNINTSPAVINAQASNLTELSFDAQVVTNTWQGYYGSLVGKIQLKDANSSILYNWDMVSPTGEVYATRSPSVDWTTVKCANITDLEIENTILGVEGNASDSVTNTFKNTSTFDRFFTGDVQINTSQNCYATHLNDNTGAQSTNYAEILLSDSNLMIYTALLDPGTIGFDGNNYDFEMLVGENGHNEDIAPTMYYFYVEIG